MTRWGIVLLLAGAVACRPDCTPTGSGDAPIVLLVTVDTLRADHLASYGHPQVRTPAFDRLGAEGVRFTRAYSASNATLPSHSSLFTSASLTRHGVLSNRPVTPARLPTLPGLLHAGGYRTAAFVSAYHVGPKMVFGAMLPDLERFEAPRRVSKPRRAEETVDQTLGWLKGACRAPAFAWVHIWDPHMPYEPPPPWNESYYHGDPRAPEHTSFTNIEFDWALHDMNPAVERLRKAPGALRRIKDALHVPSRKARRLALSPPELRATAHDDALYRTLYGQLRPVLADLHRTLPLNNNLAGMLRGIRDLAYPRALYAGEVSYVDQELGRLVSTLESWGLRDRLVVVVTADHGEGLGEHGIYCNHIGLFQEIVHVPLIVWAPGRVPPAVRDDLASGLDVAPTMLRLLNLDVPAGMEGHDLMHGTPRRDLVVESLLDLEVALVDGQWKLLHTLHDYYATTRFNREAGTLELYDLAADPLERTNVAAAAPERAADMGARLDAWIAAHGLQADPTPTVPDMPEIAPADRNRLRALGYVD